MRTLEEIRADINIAISEGNESSLRELVVELESHDSTEADALSARTEGDVCFLASDFSSAIACMEKARGIYSVLGDSLEEAGVALRIAEFLTRSGDPLKARVVFEESHAVYTRLEDRVGEASSLTGLGTTYMNTGDYQQALEVYEKATTLFNDVNDNAKLAKVVVLVGTTYMHMREYAKACQNLERAQSMFREMGLSSGEGEAVYNLGVLYYHSSQLPLALEYFEQALALYRQAKSRQGEANAIVCLGNVYKDTGDLARALEYYEKALECYSQIGARSGEAAACANLGSLKQRQGQFEQAEAYIMQAIRLQVELGRVPEAIHSMSTLCSLLLMQGDYTRAKDVLDRQETMYPSVSVTHSLHHIHRASLQVHDGELLKGQEHLQTALEIAKAANLPSVESLAHFELRNLSQKLNDFQAYIQHNEAYVRINEEINGKEATQKLTMMEAERKIRTERQEREKERAVLYSTLPKHVADRVIRGETISDHFEQAAVFFSDIVGFTSHSSEMDAPDVVRLLETLFRSFDELCAKHGITKVKTIGDAYLCFKGDEGGFANAQAVAAFATELQSATRHWPNGEPMQLRIGLHIGTATAGVIGTERLQYDVWGDTVNVASRMESTSEPGRIHVSEAFANALSNAPANARAQAPSQEEQGTTDDSAQAAELVTAFTTSHRGEVDVKGKGMMKTYWLEGK